MAATLCMSSSLCILDKNPSCQAIKVRSAVTRSNRIPVPGPKRAPLSSSLLGVGVSVQSPGPATRKVASQRGTPVMAATYHTVQAGDICFDIWNRYGLSDTQFYALNPGIVCDNLQIGQKVKISDGGSSSDPGVQGILNAVNSLRARHKAAPVSWNSTVAQYAQNYANQLIANGQFTHSGGPYGENLFAGGGSNWTVQDAINSWYDEVNKYDFNNPGFSSETGHFTALVWRGTTSIGVGVAKGNGRTVISMNFDPPGNFLGQFGSNVLR